MREMDPTEAALALGVHPNTIRKYSGIVQGAIVKKYPLLVDIDVLWPGMVLLKPDRYGDAGDVDVRLEQVRAEGAAAKEQSSGYRTGVKEHVPKGSSKVEHGYDTVEHAEHVEYSTNNADSKVGPDVVAEAGKASQGEALIKEIVGGPLELITDKYEGLMVTYQQTIEDIQVSSKKSNNRAWRIASLSFGFGLTVLAAFIAVWILSSNKISRAETLAEVKKGDLAAAWVELADGRDKATKLTEKVGGLTGQVKMLAEQAAQIRTERDKAADQVASLNKSFGTATAEARAAMVQVEALTAELEKIKALNETLMDPNVN